MLTITEKDKRTFGLELVSYNTPVYIASGKWAGRLAVYCGGDHVITFIPGNPNFQVAHYAEACDWKYTNAPGVAIQFTSN